MARKSPNRDDDMSLAVRAAWLHYAGGLTQSDVAKRLGVTSVKAHRLIMRANQEGLVKVTIDGDISECVELEWKLAQKYSLDFCEVAPDLAEVGLPVRTLGVVGAAYLEREIQYGNQSLIGIGHGRTLSAVVAHMPRVEAKNVQFVSLLGGLTRNYSANPHDVMHRLAAKTSASAFVMPVPFFANSEQDREILLAQRGVSEIMAMAERSDLKIIGIGSAESDAQIVASGMIEPSVIADLKAQGAQGEILGHFLNADGALIETELTKRTLSVGVLGLKKGRIVAVAGGKEKVRAIGAALKSGFLCGLITDERTAIALLEDY